MTLNVILLFKDKIKKCHEEREMETVISRKLELSVDDQIRKIKDGAPLNLPIGDAHFRLLDGAVLRVIEVDDKAYRFETVSSPRAIEVGDITGIGREFVTNVWFRQCNS
jgi:hypothetical protein